MENAFPIVMGCGFQPWWTTTMNKINCLSLAASAVASFLVFIIFLSQWNEMKLEVGQLCKTAALVGLHTKFGWRKSFTWWRIGSALIWTAETVEQDVRNILGFGRGADFSTLRPLLVFSMSTCKQNPGVHFSMFFYLFRFHSCFDTANTDAK